MLFIFQANIFVQFLFSSAIYRYISSVSPKFENMTIFFFFSNTVIKIRILKNVTCNIDKTIIIKANVSHFRF